MSGKALSFELSGVSKLLRAIQLTNVGTRERTIVAIEKGTKRVAAGAISRVPRRTGELAETIRDEYSKDRLTGYVKSGYGTLIRRSRAKSAEARKKHNARRQRNREKLATAKTSKQALQAIDLGVYAPVVERGDKRRNKPAHPFTVPAFRAERSSIVNDLKAAPIAAGKEAGFE